MQPRKYEIHTFRDALINAEPQYDLVHRNADHFARLLSAWNNAPPSARSHFFNEYCRDRKLTADELCLLPECANLMEVIDVDL